MEKKTIFTRFLLMLMMLKFAEHKFFMSKIRTIIFDGKGLWIFNSMTVVYNRGY